MMTGTIVKAVRKQIGIEILWDGDKAVSRYRHDDCVNPVPGEIDMLDGRGVRVGMRVEMLPEHKFKLTSEAVPEPGRE